MRSKPYNERSSRAQRFAVREGFEKALDRYGVRATEIRCITHEYNTTFSAVVEGEKLAFRVSTSGEKSEEELGGEFAFIERCAEFGVPVPLPKAIFGGSKVGKLTIDGMEGDVPFVAYSWLQGSTLKKQWSRLSGYGMGDLLRKMHLATDKYDLPKGSFRPSIDGPLVLNPWVLPDNSGFEWALKEFQSTFDSLKKRLPLQLIHNDLHYWNAKWDGEKLAVFDFDDSLWAWPALDASVTIYYLRGEPNTEKLEKNFWEGLGGSPTDLGVSREEFEALVASRQLLMVNEVFRSSNADWMSIREPYRDVSLKRLEHYRNTGYFDPSVSTLSNP